MTVRYVKASLPLAGLRSTEDFITTAYYITWTKTCTYYTYTYNLDLLPNLDPVMDTITMDQDLTMDLDIEQNVKGRCLKKNRLISIMKVQFNSSSSKAQIDIQCKKILNHKIKNKKNRA